MKLFNFFSYCGLAIVFSTGNIVLADSSRFLSFNEAAEIALRDNADILQIRAQEESVKKKENQSLSPNSPLFSYTNNNSTSPFKLSEGTSKTYGLQWTLGFPGKSLLQAKSFGEMAQSFREQGFEKEVVILTNLSNLFIQISADTQLVKILEQEVQRTAQVLKLIEHRYALGQSSQVDLLSSKSAVAKLEHDLLNAKETSKVLQAQFLSILRKPESNFQAEIEEKIDVPELHQTEEELIQTMLHNRHIIQSDEYQVKSARATATVAGLQALPDFQLNAGMNIYSLPASQANPNLSRDYTFGFQIAIPIFFPINELNTYRSAKADLASAEFQADSTRLQAIADLKSNVTRYQAGFRQLKDTQDFLLPATKAAYDLTIKSYSLGKSDYLRLSDARNNWVETQKDELSKRSELAQLFNAITLSLGCDFRNKEGPHACQ